MNRIDYLYCWDNWCVQVDGTIHRYTLSASRGIKLGEHHHVAEIRHFTSQDGLDWRDEGTCLKAGPPGALDDTSIWTGSTLYKDRTFYLFYTSRHQADGDLQRIFVAVSSDGHNFTKHPGPILCPVAEREAVSRLGYDLSNDDGYIMAWRDPWVVDQGDQLLMLFAAKQRLETNQVIPVVGIATAPSPAGPWQLQPPLVLPVKEGQLEVPSVIYKDGHWFMTLSQTVGTSLKPDRMTACLSSTRPTADWRLTCGPKKIGLYGLTLFKAGDQAYAAGFFDESQVQPLTMTDIYPVEFPLSFEQITQTPRP